MSWTTFLQSIAQSHQQGLTPHEMEVFLCLREEPGQTKQELLEVYQTLHSPIEEEAFTQRLRTIYRKFSIHGKGYKLPQLHRHLSDRYQQSERDYPRFGLNRIHATFPTEAYAEALHRLIQEGGSEGEVAILQTFAPNLDHYRQHLIACLERGVRVRILLAWPYSLAAGLRGEVLKRYASNPAQDDLDVQSCVIANLETLEEVLRRSPADGPLSIRLYDTLPSLSMYRAGDLLFAAPFLHGSLAIHTFQMELDLQASDPLLTGTLLKDFELMWTVARPFTPSPDQAWRNALRILFTV
jgi:hypothetical protein